MRILVTSDLHYEATGSEPIRRLIAGMDRENPDIVVIAGDVGNPPLLFDQCLSLFVRMGCPVAVLPGNHDLWRSGEEKSQVLLEVILPEMTRTSGFHWLEDAPIKLNNGTAIVGSIGWYDYSAREPHLNFSDEDVMKSKAQFCNDARNIDWEFSDTEFAAQCRARVMRQCRALEADPDVKNIVVITHVPVMESQVRRRPEDDKWSLRNAFFGHLTLGEELKTISKLHSVVSGHAHFGMNGTIDREGGLRPVATAVVPSDYGKPRWVVVEV